MNAKASSAKKKPLEIKRGNVTVKIYSGTNRVGSVVYPQFTLAYYSGAKRVKRNFGDLEEAKREGELVANKLANGENEVLKLTSLDRAVYVQATELLRPLNLPLNVAIGEYVNAAKLLPSGTTLRDAVEFFVRRNPASLPQRTVQQVVDELLDVKRKAGRGDVHVKDLESRLNKFAGAFQMNISQVTGTMIETFLGGLQANGLTGRTRRNHLKHITTLFNFAIRRRYLPKDALDEIQAVEKPEEELGDIEIFSPAEIQEIFAAARPEIRPWLVISAFAGLRNAEMQRLDWAEVDLKQRHIEVTAKNSKTASRRLVPITDNLLEWLTPYAESTGRVTSFENMAKQIHWLVQDVNAQRKAGGVETVFKWKRNALRHSYVSYRTAAIKDVAQVALECGNSPTMIFKHYRQLVTEEEAARWFSIKPFGRTNTIMLPKKAEAA